MESPCVSIRRAWSATSAVTDACRGHLVASPQHRQPMRLSNSLDQLDASLLSSDPVADRVYKDRRGERGPGVDTFPILVVSPTATDLGSGRAKGSRRQRTGWVLPSTERQPNQGVALGLRDVSLQIWRNAVLGSANILPARLHSSRSDSA